MDVVMKKVSVPWVIGYEVRILLQLIDKMDVVMTHAYRENAFIYVLFEYN